jgi:hypothetical protein
MKNDICGIIRKTVGLLAIATLLNHIVIIPVLCISDSEKDLILNATAGDKVEISFFHSIYHVPQKESWTIGINRQMVLNSVYFGSLDAALYYDPFLADKYKKLSQAEDYILYPENVVFKRIVLHVTPSSRFTIRIKGKTIPLYDMFSGVTYITIDNVSLFRWISGGSKRQWNILGVRRIDRRASME